VNPGGTQPTYISLTALSHSRKLTDLTSSQRDWSNRGKEYWNCGYRSNNDGECERGNRVVPRCGELERRILAGTARVRS